MRLKVSFLLVFFALAVPVEVPALQTDDVISGLESRYSKIASISADFSQRAFMPGAASSEESSGKLYLKKPGRIKWVYSKGSQDIIVSNGKTLWVYQAEFNQVIETSASIPMAGGAAFDLLTGAAKLRSDFSIAVKEKSSAGWVIELTPKEPAGFKRAEITAGRDYLITKSIVEDNIGNSIEVNYSNIKTDPAIEDSIFEFTPPKGATVLKN